MLSDTLFDAITEMERYQRDFPDYYDDIRPRIEIVKNAMRGLQLYLDSPFSTPEHLCPSWDAWLLASLDTPPSTEDDWDDWLLDTLDALPATGDDGGVS